MSAGDRYLAAAYVVLLLFLLVYVAIIAAKLARLERELDELARLATDRRGDDEPSLRAEELRVG